MFIFWVLCTLLLSFCRRNLRGGLFYLRLLYADNKDSLAICFKVVYPHLLQTITQKSVLSQISVTSVKNLILQDSHTAIINIKLLGVLHQIANSSKCNIVSNTHFVSLFLGSFVAALDLLFSDSDFEKVNMGVSECCRFSVRKRKYQIFVVFVCFIEYF